MICDPPQAPENGNFTPSNRTFYFFGEVITYECDEEYGLVGEATAVCMNRTSFAVTPTCESELLINHCITTSGGIKPVQNGSIKPCHEILLNQQTSQHCYTCTISSNRTG